jgi:four helix bundle protein
MEGMEGKQRTRVESPRRNVNRGYRKLVVWQDAIDYYVLTCRIFRVFPYELRRVASNQIAAVDSVHRNIAEGYCRRTLNEYLQHLNYAMGSVGESVSGLHAYRNAEQVSEADFEQADALVFKLENGLKRLIESLQSKRQEADWEDSFIDREADAC